MLSRYRGRDGRQSSVIRDQWYVLPVWKKWAHNPMQDPLRVVLPLPLHTTALKPSSLKSIFTALSSLPISSIPEPFPPLVPAIEELRWQLSNGQSGNKEATKGQAEPQPSGKADSEAIFPEVIELDRQMIYIAIVTSDSTVVYYKLSKGIKKPADIPDE